MTLNAPDQARLRCPRCGKLHLRREGAVQSSLDWFACLSCSHVWSARRGGPSTAGCDVKHILIVDDDDAVVSVVTAALRDYKISACVNPNDALTILRQDRIDLLVADYLMPSMSGDELVRRARAARPGLRAVIVTGYAGAVQTIGLEEVAVLQKPFSRDELLATIARQLGTSA